MYGEVSVARNIRAIAEDAAMRHPLPDSGTLPSNVGAYVSYVREAWQQFVADCGLVYKNVEQVSLTLATREFDLPDDFRRLIEARLGYLPRTISTISRAAGGVVSVRTATAHNLPDGCTVRIADVTPVGATVFDGDFTDITVVDTDDFTYTDTETTADTGAGGEVQAAGTSVGLEIVTRAVAAPTPEYEATAGQPQYLFLPDNSFVFAVEPVSDGGYPNLLMEYDGEVPDTIDVNDSAGLPAPGWVEKGLIGYAAARAGVFPDGLRDYDEVLVRWRRAASRRGAVNRARAA